MHTNKKVRFQAHRGVSTEFPGNTLIAFKAAVDQGYDLIELDPKFTADNRCVILHDRTINRTARNPDGSEITPDISIGSITRDQAKEYDFGIAKATAFRGEKIPDLEEALQFSKKFSIPLKFDNVMESFTQEQLSIFFETIKKARFDADIGFTCKTTDFLRKVVAEFPNAEIHFDGPFDEETLRMIRACLKNNRLTVWVSFQSATPKLCALVIKYAELGIWILSSDEQAKTAIDTYHADVIETNGEVKPEKYKSEL